MRQLTVDTTGKQTKTICLHCGKSEVLLKDWNKRCTLCRAKQRIKDEEEQRTMIGRRTPAAVIKTDDGREVFVDKFGNEVDNPGYDLKNDPRGWGYTGTSGSKKTTIT